MFQVTNGIAPDFRSSPSIRVNCSALAIGYDVPNTARHSKKPNIQPATDNEGKVYFVTSKYFPSI